METLQRVSHIACDLHKKFTIATARDAQNRLFWRQRLEHADRPRLRAQLDTWPKGTPVTFEASFGWGWFADAEGTGSKGRPFEESPGEQEATADGATGEEATGGLDVQA